MTQPTPGELYVEAMAATRAYLDAVRADQWQAPTPCSEWDVKQIANHLIGENLWAGELYRGRTIDEVGGALDGDLAGDGPAAAYRESVRVATDAVTAPGAMEATCHLSFGDYSGADYAKQLLLDTLIHGWDIARGTGQDTTLDPELVSACLPIAEELTRRFRAAGVFGENLPVDAAADPQTKLLALVGRRA
jgi:uncharacterized protein (TIGR03086 family)